MRLHSEERRVGALQVKGLQPAAKVAGRQVPIHKAAGPKAAALEPVLLLCLCQQLQLGAVQLVNLWERQVVLVCAAISWK